MAKGRYIKGQRKALNRCLALLLPLLMLVLPLSMTAQSRFETYGKEFWAVFMSNYQRSHGIAGLEMSITVAAKKQSHITLECYGVSSSVPLWQDTFSVAPDNVVKHVIPDSLVYMMSPLPNGIWKSVRILSTEDVTVHSANFSQASLDMAYLLPIQTLGSEYMIQIHPPKIPREYEQYRGMFTVTATENSTLVEIVPSVPVVLDTTRPAGVPIQKVLNKGQSLLLTSVRSGSSRDLSGTKIKAFGCKKIAVFQGNELTFVPNDTNGAGDHIFSQAVPVSAWGKEFAVTRTILFSGMDRSADEVRVTASQNNTVVKKNGVPVATLQSGQTYQFIMQGTEVSAFLETSNPAAVYMYLVGNEYGQNFSLGDPSMMWIPPLNQTADSVLVNPVLPVDSVYASMPFGVPQFFNVNIVVKTADTSKVFVDTLHMMGWDTLVGNGDYSYIRSSIYPSTQLIYGAEMVVHMYGLGPQVSYASFIAAKPFVDMLVDSVSIRDTNVQHYFNAGCGVNFAADVRFDFDTVEWDFGDGTQLQYGQTVTHGFHGNDTSYVVTMIVHSSTDCNYFTDTLKFAFVYIDTLRDTIARTICAGARFDTLGHTYRNPGFFTEHITDSAGCITNLVINLSVTDTLRDTIHPVICAGARFDTNGHLGYQPASGHNYGPYYRQGVYTQHLRTPDSCYYNLVIDLAVNDTLRDTIYPVICAGGRFDTLGHTYRQPGVSVVKSRLPDSCYHNLVIDLTVLDTLRDTVHPVICAGGRFDTLCHTYRQPGVYVVKDRLPDSCYHNLVIDLTVLDTLRDTVHPVICAGGRFDTLGHTYRQPGVYVLNDRLPDSCFHNIVIHLTVNDTLRDTLRRTICAGGRFDTLGLSLRTAGFHTLSQRLPDSCYHNFVIGLTVNDTLRDTVNRTIDPGGRFDTNGVTYRSQGVFTQYLREPNSCYHNLVINITMRDTLCDTIYPVICAGAQFDTNRSLGYGPYTAAGEYVQRLRYADSIWHKLIIRLTVNDTFRDTLHPSICNGQSFTIGGQSFSTQGWHTLHLTSIHGCDSIFVIDLTVNDTYLDTIRDTICAGNTYTRGGQSYTRQGDYTQRLSSVAGCDSVEVIRLSVNDTFRINRRDVLCAGDTLFLAGHAFSTTGRHLLRLSTLHGCDSVIEINLTVRDTLRDTVHRAICRGTSFDTLNHSYQTAGYHTIYQRFGRCFHNLVAHVVVNDTFRDTLHPVICSGARFTIGDSSYSTTGVYPQYLQSASGCDSTIVVNLTVNDTLRDTIDRRICRGEWVDVRGIRYTQTGSFVQRFRQPDSCFSNIYVQLAVLDTYHIHFDTTMCAGSAFVYGDSTFNTQGSYNFVVRDTDHCDIVFVDLTIADTLRDTVHRTVCPGASFDTIGEQYFVAGWHTKHLQDPTTNCLRNLVIHLTVSDTTRDTVHPVICAGASFDTTGYQYYNQGVYRRLLQDPVSRCYSLLIIDLTVNDTLRDTVYRTVCAGASFDTNGQQYHMPGWYTQQLRDPITHCFHNLVIHLSVNDTLRDTVHPVICAGEYFDTNGVRYTTQGLFVQRTQDSITHCYHNLYVNLTVNDTFRDTLRPTICQGSAYLHDNHRFDTTGVYTIPYQTLHGCDSIIVIELTVLDTVRHAVQRTICAGKTFDTLGHRLYLDSVYIFAVPDSSVCGQHILTVSLTVLDTLRDTIYRTISAGASFDTNGRQYFFQGQYTQHLRTPDSCFQNLVINIAVLDTLRDTVRRTLCAGARYDTNGHTYYFPGVYRQYNRDSLTGVFSNLVVYIDVNDTLRDTVRRTLCAGARFDTNGYIYRHQGVFTQYLREIDSCYHNLVVFVDVLDTLRDTVYRTLCAGASFDTNGRQYYLQGQYTQHMREPDSCYHNLVINISVLDTLRDTVHPVICAGQTFDTNGRSYSRQGQFIQYLRDPITRCFNDLVINLTVNDTFRDHIYDTLCAGDTFTHNNISYTMPGTHLQRYSTVLGCDSIVAIHLHVRDTLRDTVHPIVCAGAGFDTNGRRYYIQGVYTQYLRDNNSCFHNLVIDLTVNDTIRAHVYDTVCEGTTYRFNSQYYTNTGVYQYMMRNSEGCDSITYLHLQVNPQAYVRVYDTCYTGAYHYVDTVYTQPGSYYHTFQRVGTGCDSVVVLYLKFCDSILTKLYDTICNDSVYRFGNTVLTSSGTYYRKEFSYKGCDSIIELNLVVVDYPTLQIVDSGGYCHNGYATLKLHTNGNSITWSSFPHDSSLTGQEHSRTLYVSPSRYTVYTVVVDSVPRLKTCTSTARINLSKASKVQAIMKRNPLETTMDNLQTQFTDISLGNVVYRDWLFHESSEMAADRYCQYDSIVWFTPLAESDSFRVRLAVRNDAGCTDTVTNIYPILKADLWVPNAFTPDEDLNTLFKVGAYNLAEYEIYIYNRAGLLVFHSTSPDDSWDGTHNGQQCIPGSYVYIIRYATKVHPKLPQKKVGSVLLIR